MYDSICDACRNFLGRPEVLVSSMYSRARAVHWPDDNAPPAAKFHSTFADMKVSAQRGCHLCTIFLESFGTPDIREAIPDASIILAEMYRFRDSAGQNMASVCVWPTKTNDNAGMNKFFRKFCISHLVGIPVSRSVHKELYLTEIERPRKEQHHGKTEQQIPYNQPGISPPDQGMARSLLQRP